MNVCAGSKINRWAEMCLKLKHSYIRGYKCYSSKTEKYLIFSVFCQITRIIPQFSSVQKVLMIPGFPGL